MNVALQIWLSTYLLVLLAEVVGDKLLYTTGILAARFQAKSVVVGVLLAFSLKMGVAVWIAQLIARLPRTLVATVTAVNFLGIAYFIWRRSDLIVRKRYDKERSSTRQGILVSFAAVFFSEWGDVGQVTCATVAIKYGEQFRGTPMYHLALGLVWLGAVSAMMTKGAVAATAGAGLRQWIRDRVSPRTMRYGAVSLLLVVGSLSVLEILGYLPG